MSQHTTLAQSLLAQRLQQPQALLAPGVYDALTALVAQQAGFEALYLSGASIAYTRLGRSDIGLTTATEVAQTLAHITDRVSIPVIVDADTGFGNALNTQRTVRWVLSALPKPVSASTITGMFTRSVMWARVCATSVAVVRPMSERPRRV